MVMGHSGESFEASPLLDVNKNQPGQPISDPTPQVYAYDNI